MCPLCITTAALSVAGATSGAGLIALTASKWRTLRGWAVSLYRRDVYRRRNARQPAGAVVSANAGRRRFPSAASMP